MRSQLFLALLLASFSLYAYPILATQIQKPHPTEKARLNESTNEISFLPTALPPVTRIVFYNAGIAQVFHAGSIDGSRQIELKLSDRDVDDVLKSLVVDDAGGGHVRAVEYQTAPDEVDYAAYLLTPPLTLAQMLQRFRGETVSFRHQDERVSGPILAVETRTQQSEIVETLVLNCEGGITSFSIPEISNLKFDNQELSAKLEMALEGIARAREANHKKLLLLFSGVGNREIQFSYNTDAPIWRMTYRLETEGEKGVLQGWVHLDNVTGVDWTSVQVELRSGRPNSFHAEVFAPIMAMRPSLGLLPFEIPSHLNVGSNFFGNEPDEWSTGRQKYGSISNGPSDRFPLGLGGGGFGVGGGNFGGGGGFGRDYGNQTSGGSNDGMEDYRIQQDRDSLDIDRAFRAAAERANIDRAVQIRISQPVTLASGKSAMIPVFNEPVSTFPTSLLEEKLSLDSGTIDHTCFTAIQFENASDLPVLPGPVTVFRKGEFQGDTVLRSLPATQRQFVTFGVDVALKARQLNGQPSTSLKRVSRHGTEIVLSHRTTQNITFEIRNEDTQKRTLTLLLELPEEGLKLEPPPEMETDAKAKYEIEIMPKSKANHQIVVNKETTQTRKVVDILGGDLDWRVPTVEITDADRKYLEEVLRLSQSVSKLKMDLREIHNQKEIASEDQNRKIRLLQSLRDAGQDVTDLVAKLRAGELEAENYTAKVREVESEMSSLQKKLDEMIGGDN